MGAGFLEEFGLGLQWFEAKFLLLVFCDGRGVSNLQ